MIKRYNYTGRKKLPQKAFRIRLQDDIKIRASGDLGDHGLPDSAAVYIEVFTSGSAEVVRIPFGTIAEPKHEVSHSDLADFTPLSASFNAKIVDESENVGRLVGVALNIRHLASDESASGSQSILPVNPADLGDEVWRVSFDHERPWLEVNRSIPDIMTLIREDRSFFSLVYPAVIRQILAKILIIDQFDDPEGDSIDWRVQWLKWGIHWHPDRETPQQGDLHDCIDSWLEWIETVARAFCRKHRVQERFIHRDGEEDAS